MIPLLEKIGSISRRYLDTRLVFVMDLAISVFMTALVGVLAYFVGLEEVLDRRFTLILLITSAVGSGLMFFLLRTYKIVIRHFMFKDTAMYFLACLGKVVFMWAVVAVFGLGGNDQFVVLLVADFFASVIALCAVRVVMIYVYERYKTNMRQVQKTTRVLVFGVSEKSIATIIRLRNSKHYTICGFLSSDKGLGNKTFADKHVYSYGDREDFGRVVTTLSLGGILFATEDDAKREQDGIVKYCSELGVKVLIVPAIDEMNSGNDQFRVRPVDIEDLLGRDVIRISYDEIGRELKDKVVLVTGAAGSIGSELCRQLAGFGLKKLILYDNGETPMHNLRLELEERFPNLEFVPVIGDVRLKARLDFAFRSHHPQIVFHAAAYKHVPLMEENPCEAVLVNVVGSRNVADKCLEYGVGKMVMISTDKAVNPTNIMGCTKRLAEIYVQSLGLAVEAGSVEGKTKFVTTRFGNVLGSNGSVIPRFRDQIAKGGPVTVTHPDITRFFMTIPEACSLVLEAAAMHTENRICVFDMGAPVKIDTLARRMIELSGFEPDKDIKIVYSGLRPGEKLYEEVLSNVENTEPTSHERIRIAKVRLYDHDEAIRVVDELERLSRAVQIPEMVKLMKRTVPEYVSKNSKFEEFDATK